MELSKQQSVAIKGIAILLMLWHHLFMSTSQYGTFVQDSAIFFKVCVALFLFVSGYGLTKQYSQLQHPYLLNTLKFLLRRFINFFLPYWFCFAIVMIVGHLCGYTIFDAYPSSRNTIKCFLLDFWGLLGWQSYITTWWFNKLIIQLYLLFPILYIIVRNRYSAIAGIVIVAILQIIQPINLFCISEGGLPSFFLGMIFAKHQILHHNLSTKQRLLYAIISLLLLIVLGFLHQHGHLPQNVPVLVRSISSMLIVFIYAVCMPNIPVLEFVGRYATIMYLTHTLIQKLLHNIIYWSSSPIIIYLIFATISLSAAILILRFQHFTHYDRLSKSLSSIFR